MDALRHAVREAALQLPKPAGVPLAYGTAGFRHDAALLDSTVQRCALLAALRSLQQGGRATGVMVTASHNPPGDNGVKIADANGGMLVVSWEAHATRLANAESPDDLVQAVEAIVEQERVQVGEGATGQVLLARDTRDSGPRLLEAALQGVALVPAVTPISYSLLTTPQLHWLVWAANRRAHASSHTSAASSTAPFSSPSPLPSEDDYFSTLASAFTALLTHSSSPSSSASSSPAPSLLVDAANGVGAPKLQRLLGELQARGDAGGEAAAAAAAVAAAVVVRNAGGEGEGRLNEGVGADFVQKEQRAPGGFGGDGDLGHRCVSVDGDADRLVYFYHTPPSTTTAPDATTTTTTTAAEATSTSPGPTAPTFHLLDGDKIAALLVSFLAHTLRSIPPSASSSSPSPSPSPSPSTLPPCAWFPIPSFRPISLGAVQTAYANGASSAFLQRQLGVPPAVARTGVKHVHAVAERWDVGVYFEANGHGTVLFGEELAAWLEEQGEKGVEEGSALHCLLHMSRLCNQAVGDALANLLAVEAVLRCKGWSHTEWSDMYRDLPSRQLKVRVAERSLFVPCDDDTRLLQPAALQTAIDAAVAGVSHGRAFVRPSGTEDVVRVYAEGSTQEAADALARTVAAAVGAASPPPLAA